MILVDTGYFIGYANQQDGLRGRVLAWNAVLQEKLLVTEYVLWETLNQLSSPKMRGRGHAIADVVRTRPAYEFIPASPALWERGLQFHRQHADKAWSLTDCISFQVMLDRGIQRALSHDHHFTQAGFDALLRRDPP